RQFLESHSERSRSHIRSDFVQRISRLSGLRLRSNFLVIANEVRGVRNRSFLSYLRGIPRFPCRRQARNDAKKRSMNPDSWTPAASSFRMRPRGRDNTVSRLLPYDNRDVARRQWHAHCQLPFRAAPNGRRDIGNVSPSLRVEKYRHLPGDALPQRRV